MNARKSVSILALTLALGGGMLATPAFAAVPSNAGDVKVMDTNKNGKVEKDEYLAYMSKLFDKAAGTKGYCTFEEIKAGFPSGFNFNSYAP
jgi:ABC-type sugar transport system substrate-binding protein